jgi:phosphoenolpyruvate-protein phosphotransferase
VIVTGIPVSGGIAVGRLVVVGALMPTDVDSVSASESGGSAEERMTRLVAAVAASRQEISSIAAQARQRIGSDPAAIIEAQLLVLDDPEWWEPIRDEVLGGAEPTTAVRSVTEAVAEALASLDDPYLRERSADVLDVGQRVAGHLVGRSRTHALHGQTGDVVVAAHELTPTDTLDLDLDVVRGIVTEAGARTSHAAILARQLGIPAVVGAVGVLEAAAPGVVVVLDGDAGTCEIDPEPHALDLARARSLGRATPSVITQSVTTRDGVQVHVLANASSVSDVERAVAEGADGIGLYRTEFLFMRSDGLPDEATQAEHYAAVAEAAGGRPVTFRTLDVGGDKPVPGLQMDPEENPFLGVRGIRLTLANRPVFDAQLRALARTSDAFPGVSVMVPMVSGLEELDDVRRVLQDVAPRVAFRLGAMVEVPSAALLVDALAQEVDFLSVGTNDLTAYLLAADRGNRHLHGLYSEFHPAVLRALHLIRDGAKETPVSVCGELAGDPRATGLLIGLGYRQLSVSGPLVPAVKERIRTIDTAAAERAAEVLLRARRHRDVDVILESRPFEA